MTTARDLGTGPRKPFGSALPADAGGAFTIPIITERPRRLKAIGPCKLCGSWFHGCPCEEEDNG